MTVGRSAGRFSVLAAVALGCFASLPADPALAGGWAAPVTVSPPGQYVEAPQAAVDERGDEAVVWEDRINPYHTKIEISLRPDGGSFASPVTVTEAPGENSTPSVALGPRGEALVAWSSEADTEHEARELIETSSGSVATGSFSPPTPVSGYEGGNGWMYPHVGIAADGEAVAVWAGLDGRLHYATRPAGSDGFGAPRSVTNPGGTTMFSPSIDISPGGSAVAAWTDYQHVYATVREAGGSFGAVQTVESAKCEFDGVHAAIDAAGVAVLEWPTTNDECDSGVAVTLMAAYRPPGETFEAPVAAAAMGGWSWAGDPAVSPAGRVTISALGEMTRPASPGSLTALTRSADGSWGEPEAISRDDAVEEPPALAYDAAGNLYGGSDTRTYEEGSGEPISGIVGNIAPAGEGFAAESSLLQSVRGELDTAPVIAAAGSGQAVAAWATGVVGERFSAEVSSALSRSDGAEAGPPPASEEAGGEAGAPSASESAPDDGAQHGGAGDTTAAGVSVSVSPGASTTTASTGTAPTAGKPGDGPVSPARGLAVTGPADGARWIVVRLLRAGHLLTTARARISHGRYRAILEIGSLRHGRYRLEVLMGRGTHERRAYRWIELPQKGTSG